MNEPQQGWTIVIDRQAQKEMRLLPSEVRPRIDKAILALTEDPRPVGSKSVKDAPQGTYRLRVGTYRLIYGMLSDTTHNGGLALPTRFLLSDPVRRWRGRVG